VPAATILKYRDFACLLVFFQADRSATPCPLFDFGAPARGTTAQPRHTMRFRPCIDLHNGVVKQIVGSSLKDVVGAGGGVDAAAERPVENFVSSKPSAEYAEMYRRDSLTGGHIIMLGPGNEEAALSALRAYPGGLQIGGGITPNNARKYLDAGASHVIVTSYVFNNGQIDMGKLAALVDEVGRERLVLDLSCRRKNGASDSPYYVVTDRWQKFTDFAITQDNLRLLAASCDEFLVHGVDVEGKQCGIMEDLVELLGAWVRNSHTVRSAPRRPFACPIAECPCLLLLQLICFPLFSGYKKNACAFPCSQAAGALFRARTPAGFATKETWTSWVGSAAGAWTSPSAARSISSAARWCTPTSSSGTRSRPWSSPRRLATRRRQQQQHHHQPHLRLLRLLQQQKRSGPSLRLAWRSRCCSGSLSWWEQGAPRGRSLQCDKNKQRTNRIPGSAEQTRVSAFACITTRKPHRRRTWSRSTRA
jgi:phosphoribosylformimino-5-aminoimidazole carboxamide ribotide isomerase